MKLEALNGNILPIVKMSQDEKSPTDSQEANDDEELPSDVVDDDQSADGKSKKKQTRKKRSLNWEDPERGLLLEVIKPKVDYVENRLVDAKSIKAKRLAWMQITKQFNALNFRHRSLEQIQVQWRSMKNTAKREYQSKNPKSAAPESNELLDFMEEMQKEPILTRSHTRAPADNAIANETDLKKEDIDIDEDTPLAALPTGNCDESSSLLLLQTQNAAGIVAGIESNLSDSPHNSAAESQNEMQLGSSSHQGKMNNIQNNSKKQKKTQQQQVEQGSKPKRQKSQNSNQSLDLSLSQANTNLAVPTAIIADENYKKDLYEIIKRARLSEMDFARREHEQKLRHQQMEQELKLNYYRKQEELKLQQLREEHQTRMLHNKLEHEARMRVYAARNNISSGRNDVKLEVHNNAINVASTEIKPN